MAFTADDARDYLLVATQSTLGNQAIAAVTPGKLAPRAIMEINDRDAKRIANATRLWLQDQHPTLFLFKG